MLGAVFLVSPGNARVEAPTSDGASPTLLRWKAFSASSGSTLSSTELFARSSLFHATVEENFVNCPRTVVATMCFTEKPTVLWLGSASRETEAAARRAARTIVIFVVSP